MMKFSKIAAAITFASISAGAIAGGPLYIHDKTMKPYKWDTSKGTIPVWTDGGPLDGNGVQTFSMIPAGTVLNQEMTLPSGKVIPAYTPFEQDEAFLTVEQANIVTSNAVAEWSNVETSTFSMAVAGTIESQTGIADVTHENVDQIYNAENGYGFWVNYDTDGQILEQYFGVPRSSVLGIAFPEWADEETGEIIEATALMNGWYVDVNDTDGSMVGGVFTHEFGHAINMSHSQANGHLTYMSKAYSPQYDGVPGCPGTNEYTSYTQIAPDTIETMFPFINVRAEQGRQQSTVNIKDDIVNISDLYPTAEYKAQYGSISGTLYTKEGVEYSGINIVARNLDDPLYDVVTQQSGNMTQGKVGPDGKFTINGLTPGGRYAVYLETIKAGGYPTAQTALVSVAEYWNDTESSNPATDDACAMSAITVAGGETKEIEMHFNGYQDGVQYTPLVEAFIIDHSKNGKKALGTTGSGIPFIYDSVKNTFETLVNDEGYAVLKNTSPAMDKTATTAAVVADFNGNGVNSAAVWDIRSNKLSALEDPSNNTCHLSSQQSVSSNAVWDIDDKGEIVVGTSRAPKSGGEQCAEGEGANSYAIPTIWNTKTGKATQLTDGIEFVPARYGSNIDVLIKGERQTAWIRADRVSGNGEVVTGSTNGFGLVAWVNGKMRDINAEFGARDTAVISQDGEKVAFHAQERQGRYVVGKGIQVWNTKTDKIESLGSLRWCEDIPFTQLWRNFCEAPYNYTHEDLLPLVGEPGMSLLDASDDLSVITARAGSPLAGGYLGAIYLEGIGWMTNKEFFSKQGVVEAQNLLTDNIFGLSANGSEMMAGIAGATVSIEVDANKAFVCKDGQDMELSFPKQVVEAIKKGADFGRCAHIND